LKPLFQTAVELESAVLSAGWHYSFIGGIALQRWGQPRLTNDIDITIIASFGEEESFIDLLLSKYHPRIEAAKQFALQNRVLLLFSDNKIPIDIVFGGIPFEEHLVERSSRFEFLPGLSLLTCTAEDLIVMKAFADRSRDWADIETIIIRQGNQLDWIAINRELDVLCTLKPSAGIPDHLNQLMHKSND
jgi:hypothetical protein